MIARIPLLMCQQGMGKSACAILHVYDTEKIPARKAGDCHSCITSKSILNRTSCNICLIKHAKFPNFSPFFSSSNPFLNKVRIRTCSISNHMTLYIVPIWLVLTSESCS